MNSKIMCFHNLDEDNGFLSHRYLPDFRENDLLFTSLEQYMMYHKAMVFEDSVVAGLIMATDDVAKIKVPGRQVRGYDDTVWNGVRQIVVYRGLRLKFSQNINFWQALPASGEAILAECAVKDVVRGIGLSWMIPAGRIGHSGADKIFPALR